MLKNISKLMRIAGNITNITQLNQQRRIQRWVAPTLRVLQRRRDKVGPEKVEPRSSYLEWNYDAEIFAFGKRLGESFDEDLLRTALTHRSYAVGAETNGTRPSDNHEMIARGIKTVRDCLTKGFGMSYPDDVVGVLRDYLMTEKMLARVGLHIGLKDIVLCNEFPVEQKTLADSFCAVVSALESSSGLEVTDKFINDFLVVQLTGKDLFDIWNLEDSFDYLKTVFKGGEIEPRLCNQSGTNTILANYQVGLYCEKKLLGIGFGESVDVAKNAAALDALNKMYITKQKDIKAIK